MEETLSINSSGASATTSAQRQQHAHASTRCIIDNFYNTHRTAERIARVAAVFVICIENAAIYSRVETTLSRRGQTMVVVTEAVGD